MIYQSFFWILQIHPVLVKSQLLHEIVVVSTTNKKSSSKIQQLYKGTGKRYFSRIRAQGKLKLDCPQRIKHTMHQSRGRLVNLVRESYQIRKPWKAINVLFQSIWGSQRKKDRSTERGTDLKWNHEKRSKKQILAMPFKLGCH